jgi:hypothetical protein
MKNLKLFATPIFVTAFMLLTYFYPTQPTRNYYYTRPVNTYVYTPSYYTYQVDPYDVYAGQVIDNYARSNHIINYKYHTTKSPNFAYQSIWY